MQKRSHTHIKNPSCQTLYERTTHSQASVCMQAAKQYGSIADSLDLLDLDLDGYADLGHVLAQMSMEKRGEH